MSTTRPDLTEYVSLPQAALDGWANAQVPKEEEWFPLVDGDDVDRMHW